MKMEFFAPDRLGPFRLGQSKDDLQKTFEISELVQTESDRCAGSKAYSVLCLNEEVAVIDVKCGLVESITTFTSFVLCGTEMVGKKISLLHKLLRESPGEATEVLHEDGSVVCYLDYPKAGLIVSTEADLITSVCLFKRGRE